MAKFSKKRQPRSVQSNSAYSLCGSRHLMYLFRHHIQLLKKKEQCGSAFMNRCSVHHLLSILVIFFIFLLLGVSSLLLTPHLQDSVRMLVFPPVCFVPRGVSAVADPFLKTRVTKAALILTWQSHKLFYLGVLCLLVLAKGWRVERHLKRRENFYPYGSISLQILSMEELSLREKIALVIYFLTHLQNSVLPREGNV